MKTKTCWLICLFVLLCFISNATAGILANETENDAKIHKIAHAKNVGSISGWVAMGAGIRRSATGGIPPIQDILGNGSFTIQSAAVTLAKFYAGLIALLAFSALFAFGSCIMWPSFFCCRACGACGGDKPRDGGYDKNEKICAAVTLGVSLLLIFIGCIIGLVTNALISRSINEAILSFNETANDAAAFPGVVEGAFLNVVNDIDDSVNKVFDIVLAVPESVLGKDGSLTQIVTDLTTVIKSLQGSFDKILQEGKDLDTTINGLLTKLDTLSTETQTLNSQIAAFSTDKPYAGNNSVTYHVNATCLQLDQITPITIANASGLLPPISNLIDQVNVNLTTVADTIQNTFDTIQSNFTTLINSTFAGFRSQIDGFTNTASNSVDGVTTSIESSFETVRKYQADLDKFYRQSIVPANNYRSIATIILFCLNLLIIVFAVLGLVAKKSPVMTTGICICFFLMIVFWILCLIHLILAVPVGKICDIFTERQIVEVLKEASPSTYDSLNDSITRLSNSTFGGENSTFTFPNPLAGRDLQGSIDLVYDTLDDCKNGGNLIKYLNLTGIFDSVDSLVNDTLTKIDLDGLIDSIPIGNETFGKIDLTGQVNFDSLIQDLQSVKQDFDAYVNIIESILINSTQTKCNDAKTIVNAAKSNAPLIESCLVTSPPDVSPADKTQMANAVSADLDSTSNLLTQILDTTIPSIRNDILLIRSKFDSFTQVTTNLTGGVDDILDYISDIEAKLIGITTGIKNQLKTETKPQLLGTLYELIDKVENEIVNLGDCRFLGEDLYAIINSICITAIGGVDAVWYTCGYLGLSLISVVVGIALYSKRWIRADPMDQDFNDQYYKDQEFELPPMYADEKK